MSRFLVLAFLVLVTTSPIRIVLADSPDEIEQCLSSDAFFALDQTVELCTKAIESKMITDAQKSEVLTRRANSFYWAERYDLASTDIEQAINFNEVNTDALSLKGWLAIAFRDYLQAFDVFSNMMAQHPEDMRGYYGLGYLYHDTGELKKALQLYIAALEISPKSYKVRFNLAGTYIDLRNDKAAIEEINAILAVDQKELAKVPFRHNWPIKWEYSFESNVIEFRGELLERLGQSKKALADLSEIVRRYPKNPISYQQRANLLLNMHNYRGAIDDARKAMQLDSLSCLCGRVTELKALYSLQNYDEAVSAGDRFLNLPMTDHMRGEAMFFHGLALEKTGEFEKAQQEIEAAHRYAPDYIGATMNRITQAGYYDGSPQDGYSVKASNGLKACILDPEC